ncbi:hypothetical protein K431DRAFT_287649 [Polychaeton citri CBS 116435]|uniref:WD40 repeat-like protein n=1 Tax=Polychaeton citri CBS 116435 TaxID=1314669 RepID=A0A9P4Q528_9PEZI|nr:hypothetical protein K431DRAFT_287649 [Polychaeton citri CBS 116435]
MTPVSSCYSTRLALPPSCIAFCHQAPTFFVVGTYFLESSSGGAGDAAQVDASGSPGAQRQQQQQQEAQKRSGSLVVFEISGDGGSIQEVQTVQLDSGVLDVQWQPASSIETSDGRYLLAVATSTGLVQVYRLDGQRKHLSHLSTYQICDQDTLALSLQWHPCLPGTMGVTLSDGRVCLVHSLYKAGHDGGSDGTGGREPWSSTVGIEVTTITTHELEAWWLAFSLPPVLTSSDGDSQIRLFSGGDDARLTCSLLSSTASASAEEDLGPVTIWQDRKIHQAGVTYILPLTADLVLTGSYDDHLRLLSVPTQMGVGKPKELAQEDLGGGVWRLKILKGDVSSGRILLLASCMYAGAKVVRLTQQEAAAGDRWTFEIVARFEEHQSMNYGSDVYLPPSGDTGDTNGSAREWTVISTSFYDKLMCLWKVPVDS